MRSQCVNGAAGGCRRSRCTLDWRWRVGSCGVPLMMNHFVLQAAPEALHGCVVVAVPLARHRCLHAELGDQFAIVVGTILAATVRVENQSWRRPLCSNGPPKRLRCQFLRHTGPFLLAGCQEKRLCLADGVIRPTFSAAAAKLIVKTSSPKIHTICLHIIQTRGFPLNNNTGEHG
jgi:hypothetical protein